MKQLCSGKPHVWRGYDGTAEPEQFEHNQITVLECKVNPVDTEGAEHELYRYGDDAIVELDMACEYIFYKEAYDQWKPETVVEDLKVDDTNRR
jgi:hypothetical protein